MVSLPLSLLCVHIAYIYSLLIEEDVCDCRNVSVKLMCVYLRLYSVNLFIFFCLFVKSFHFIFLFFCVIRTSALPFPRGL